MSPDPVANLSAIALFAGAYLLGSIPFGLVLTKFAGLEDIRTIGSGNIGATNVLRTGKKGLALATLLLDGGKGALAVVLARLLTGDETTAMLAGLAAVLGHIYPVWLKFKGGKGVATALGVFLAANPLLGLGMLIAWLLIAFLFRFSSLAAVVAFAASPLFAGFLGADALILPSIFLAALIIYKHHANLKRLIKGEEPKIGKKK
jgi:glycerol-3-phosphate acyltransferase PlsY